MFPGLTAVSGTRDVGTLESTPSASCRPQQIGVKATDVAHSLGEWGSLIGNEFEAISSGNGWFDVGRRGGR